MGGATQNTLPVGGLMIAGTLTSLLSKILYQLQGEGRSGQQKTFAKPYASSALMFLAMLLILPISWGIQLWRRHKARGPQGGEDQEPLLTRADEGHSAGGKQRKARRWRDSLIIIAPTAFDLLATVLMSIGLLSVSASIYQMLRGAEILFSALFAVTLLKRELNKLHYFGILGCLAGVTLVGASSLVTSSGGASANASQALVGMALIVLAQAVQAGQVVIEDYALSTIGLEPLTVVGLEGIYGTILSLLVLLPIAQFLPGQEGQGVHEDSLDTLHMISHSIPPWALPVVLLVQTVALLMYNISGMLVTEGLGAVTRTVLESARTLFVWLVDLALFYAGDFGLGTLGEGWDKSSWLQLGGFALLIAATLLYARGDQVHERELHEHERGDKDHKRPHFRPSNTIATHSHTALRMRRWRRSAAAAAERAREALSEHHGEP